MGKNKDKNLLTNFICVVDCVPKVMLNMSHSMYFSKN